MTTFDTHAAPSSTTVTPDRPQPLAVVTGASRGLGLALARALATRGWAIVMTARTPSTLAAAADQVRSAAGTARGRGGTATVRTVVGDVADADHRARVADVVADVGRLDLLVNNAGTLGPSPRPRLEDLLPDAFADLLVTNVVAQLGMFQVLHPHLAPGATVVNVTSDAAIGAWEGWGGYGAGKAALDHVSAVLAAEHPDLHVHAVDPGDLRTDMQQAAFPGEDISDRTPPDAVAPTIIDLVEQARPSGRHRVADLRVHQGVSA